MSMKSRVAVLFTRPETVLQDYSRLFDLAGGNAALDPSVTTLLKDNMLALIPAQKIAGREPSLASTYNDSFDALHRVYS
jgi:hypothetical protein